MSKCRRCDAGDELVFNSRDGIWLHVLDVEECPNMKNSAIGFLQEIAEREQQGWDSDWHHWGRLE